MLPQMMPMPWLFMFVMIFISIFSISLYISSFSSDTLYCGVKVKPSGLSINW